MLHACDRCKFLFASEGPVEQCPDCGKFAVRPAIQTESEEYACCEDAWEDDGD